MNLPLAINNCNVCGVKGNRFQCQEFNNSDTVFILPFDFSSFDEEIISSYGFALRQRFCENGSEEVCNTYLTFLIQSKATNKIVATPEYIKKFFAIDVEENEIGNIFGIKLISTRNFLSAKVKAEIQ